ncbi:MAG: arylsulfatase [Planctomycetaceae bacterium]
MRQYAWLLAIICTATAVDAQPPNIVFIMADDLGFGDLGCYGQPRIQTPNIDRLAAEGLRFTQAYAGACVCAPSRCTLMTGLHTGHCRIRDNQPVGMSLRPDDVTIAEVLKQAGYRTGMIGKWGLGDAGTRGVPSSQGFDRFFGQLNHTEAHFYFPSFLWDDDRMVFLGGNRGGARGQYTPDLFLEQALAFIEQQRDRPFCLYFADTQPHWSDAAKTSPDSLPVPSQTPYTDRDWPEVEKNYAAMVTRLDSSVGRIMDLLRRLGVDRETIVFFTSDNGPSAEKLHDVEFFDSNGPCRGSKRDLYEGGLRVPLLVRWPGHVPRGTTCDAVVWFPDVFPTLAELAGFGPPAGLDGVSIAPLLRDDPAAPTARTLYWDYGHVRESYDQAVRFGDWKAVRNGKNSPIELYDLANDPGEQHNLAAAHPDILAQAEKLLRETPIASEDYPIP